MSDRTTDKHPPFHIELAEKVLENLKTHNSLYTPGWTNGVAELPLNPVSNRRYRGGNLLNLWLTSMNRGWNDPRWMTYKQATEQGAQVRRGERGSRIVFVQSTRQVPVVNEQGNLVRDEEGNVKTKNVLLDRPIIRQSFVFNGTQIDGLPPRESNTRTFEPLDAAEKILSGSGATIRHDQLSRAFYRPSTDSIHMPLRSQFETADLYYATALHELCHWTGHESRLARLSSAPFGSEEYAKEELRAEIGSLLLTREIGITDDSTRAIGYLSSWVSLLEEQPRAILTACADAEQIRSYLMALNKEQALEGEDLEEQRSSLTVPVTSTAASLVANQAPTTGERTYLVVPYAEKDEAKAVAKLNGFSIMWDRGAKAWFVPSGIDPSPMSQWMVGSRPVQQPLSLREDPARAFGEKLREIGLVVTEPELDGTIKRVPLIGESSRKKDGAYVGTLDDIPHGWGKNYKTGEEVRWRMSQEASPNANDSRELLEAAIRKAEQAVEARKEIARTVAKSITASLETMAPASSEHPYLVRKGIDAAGLFEDERGRLVVPLRSLEGGVTTLQRISADGTKRLERGGAKKGRFFVASEKPPEVAPCVVIAEGLATAKTIAASLTSSEHHSSVSVLMAVDAYNLMAVAEGVRAVNEKALIVFAADRDPPREGQELGVGQRYAKEAAKQVSGVVVVPEFIGFGRSASLNDFNDLFLKEGLFAVQRQIEAPIGDGLAQQEAISKRFSPEETNQPQYSVAGRGL
jgi:putative DNA primase/helicase